MRRNSTIEMTEAQYNNNVCAIRDKLKETKMTIGQLSARSGVSKSLVCDILNERLIGSPPTWKKIAETLDLKFEYKDLSKKAARERAREKEENDKNSYGILGKHVFVLLEREGNSYVSYKTVRRYGKSAVIEEAKKHGFNVTIRNELYGKGFILEVKKNK